MNAEMGVEYADAMVEDVVFGDKKNEVIYKTCDGKQQTVSCRWVCDGTSRRQLIANKLGLRQEVEKNTHCSAWGHFKAKNNIDLHGGKWRRRNGFATREFSTNHFPYNGYWFWIIPQRDDFISFGLVYDNTIVFKDRPPSQDEFIEFVKKHKALDGLFAKDEVLNFNSLAEFSYTSKEVVNVKKRFIILADAAGFTDPLLSLGLDTFASTAVLFGEILMKDLRGEISGEEINELAEKINIIVSNIGSIHRTIMLGKKSVMGSCEIFSGKLLWEYISYYIILVWPFISKTSLLTKDITLLTQSLEVSSQIFKVIETNFLTIASRHLFLSKKCENMAGN